MSDIDLSSRLLDPSALDRAPKGPTRTAIAAAILLHLALIAWFLLDPRFAPSLTPPPAAIPVTLVMVPPPPPPAPAPPPPKPTPPPQFAPRQSGPGERTTAPAQATETAPEPAAPPTPAEPAPNLDAPAPSPPAAAPVETPTPTPSPTVAPAPEAKPQPQPKPRAAVAHPEPHKEAPVAAAPTHSLLNRELGEHEETGDPYLNLLWHRIEDYRQPTTPIGPSGLHLEGIATYELVVDHGGRLHGMSLLRSSGSTLLDEEVRRMIISATPFPPPPLIYPDPVAIRITIQLFPR